MSAAVPQRLELATTDAGEAAALLSSTCTPMRVWTPTPPFHLELSVATVDGVCATRLQSRSGLVLDGDKPGDDYYFAVAVSGRQSVETWAGGAPAHDNGHGLVVDGRSIRRVTFSPALDFRSIAIDSDLMAACVAEQLEVVPRERLRFAPLNPASAPTLQLAMKLAEVLHRGLSDGVALQHAPIALLNLRQSLLHLLLAGVPSSVTERLRSPRRLPPAPRHVVRAIEYMRENASRPISIADVAAAASVSVRALQEGFQRFRETTPSACLRQIRLERTRQDLLDPEMPASVSEIALRWGFVHMSLFAARYRKAFGELPSTTIRRRSRR
ncbi:MAG: helix-turn-helix transcriptional regulator [Rubrivivax sp.]